MHFPVPATIRRTLVAGLAAGASIACLVSPLIAQRSDPGPKPVTIDWEAVVSQLTGAAPALGLEATAKEFPSGHGARVTAQMKAFAPTKNALPLAHLNELARPHFPMLARIPVPVLLPVNTAKLVAPLAQSAPPAGPAAATGHLASPIARVRVTPGATGYDALVTFRPETLKDNGIDPAQSPVLHIGATALSHGRPAPGEPVPELQAQYPDLRRALYEEDVVYTFRRFGVPYFAMMDCSRDASSRDLACEKADLLIRATLRELRVTGGAPVPLRAQKASLAPLSAPRSTAATTFTYYAPDNLLPGTGHDNKGGSSSRDVYGDITFPIRTAPAYAQSQVFMHWGNCMNHEIKGSRIPLPKQKGDAYDRYKCKQNPASELLQWEGHPANYAYPWRPNFCEQRAGRDTLECPAKKGHQGQDIRPGPCVADTRPGHEGQCAPNRHDVVAGADGNIFRFKQNRVRLKNEAWNVYYVYLHMYPEVLDKYGIRDGDVAVPVKRGQVIGKVGDWDGGPRTTTTHMHFEVRTVEHMEPVNPYMTLVRAYERLIGATGVELP